MTRHPRLSPFVLCAALSALAAAPVQADEGDAATTATATESDEAAETISIAAQAAQPAPTGAPLTFAKPVFDETWATIGLGVGLVPSYAGSDNYIAFPLPLIVGRVGGVGIAPNGPGFQLDFNSPAPSLAPRTKPRVSFGPAFRIRNDRNFQIQDAVVEAAGTLDVALEVGGAVGVTFPGVFRQRDSLNVGVQARWDVLGAHEGMIIEPQIAYSTIIGRAARLQVQANAEIIDGNFAEYYFTVNPAQALASGLPVFNADGGLNRIGTIAILSYDLDGNALNGGLSLTGIGGYSRLIGDSADTPFTALRGDANQFILGLGLAYTF
jgi:outer membrane scaffolding protein for murein synthesis (MipA/OmpV family)